MAGFPRLQAREEVNAVEARGDRAVDHNLPVVAFQRQPPECHTIGVLQLGADGEIAGDQTGQLPMPTHRSAVVITGGHNDYKFPR